MQATIDNGRVAIDGPAPLNRPTVVLTDRGHAAVAIIRLRRQLARLSAEDLEAVGPLLADLVIGAARDATA